MRVSFLLFAGLLFAAPMMAQPHMQPPTAHQEAIQEVDFMVGTWEGTGWMQMSPDRRATLNSKEIVEKKLDGTMLLIEGLHTTDVEGAPEPVVIHHAMAMLTYDPEAETYRFRSALASGRTGNFEGRAENGTFVWGFDDANGRIRYTITLNEAGEWFEIGEMSRDGGATWFQFFEMTLRRTDGS